MLKQNLQQKLGLKINPLQIQLIKLLELPTYQLEQRIKEELEQNPLLEEGEDKPEAASPEEMQEEDTGNQQDEFGEEEEHSDDDEFSLEDYMDDDDDIPEYRLAVSNVSKDNDSRDLIFFSGNFFPGKFGCSVGYACYRRSQNVVLRNIL